MIKKKDLLEAISILESNQSKLEDAIKALDQKIVDIDGKTAEDWYNDCLQYGKLKDRRPNRGNEQRQPRGYRR